MKDYSVGIDPSSTDLVATILDRSFAVVAGARSFANDAEGIEEFVRWLSRHGAGSEHAHIFVENTGVYCEQLCYELDRRGLELSLLDPHKVWKAFGNGPKTDPIDSAKVAEYGLRYFDKLGIWEPNAVVVEQIRTLLVTREQLVKQKTANLTTQHSLKRKVIQTPQALAVLSVTVAHLREQIAVVEAEIRKLIRSHPSLAQMVALLATIPGVGELLAANILVMTGGFAQKPQYRRFAAFLGIAPLDNQSGIRRKRSRSRGYGPAIPRKLLHLAARSVVVHNRGFKTYYLRKVAAGKNKTLVLNNLANKLLRIICAVMRDHKPFIQNHKSINPCLVTT